MDKIEILPQISADGPMSLLRTVAPVHFLNENVYDPGSLFHKKYAGVLSYTNLSQ